MDTYKPNPRFGVMVIQDVRREESMFKKLLQKLQSLASHHSTFDPSLLDDPIAMQTDWSPLKGGGANFRTRKLVEASFNRLEFRATVGAKLFCLVFLLLGVGVLIGFSGSKLSSEGFSFDMHTIIPLLVGLTFAVTGSCLLYFGTVPIVFDRQRGFFWKGREAPDEVFSKRAPKYCARLHDIHALQLISEYCRGNKNSYYSYELNIVLENGKRINVVDHGNQNKLREDTARLSAFLGKPVWDAIG